MFGFGATAFGSPSFGRPLFSGAAFETPESSYLLEVAPGPVMAPSLRKLHEDHVTAISVRESGGGQDLDIGFDSNGALDTAALLDHVGGGDGIILQWWDPSGFGNHLVNNDPSLGGTYIVLAGSLITANGYPAIEADQAKGGGLSVTISGVSAGNTDRSALVVCGPGTEQIQFGWTAPNEVGKYWDFRSDVLAATTWALDYRGHFVGMEPHPLPDGDTQIMSFISDALSSGLTGDNLRMWLNGQEQAWSTLGGSPQTPDTAFNREFKIGLDSHGEKHRYQEYVFWAQALADSADAINANANGWYGTY